MTQIIYFINIRYLPPILLGLPIDYQSFLAPAFADPNEAIGLKNHLVDIMTVAMKKIDKKRHKINKCSFFEDFSKLELEEWIEVDNRFLAEVKFSE